MNGSGSVSKSLAVILLLAAWVLGAVPDRAPAALPQTELDLRPVTYQGRGRISDILGRLARQARIKLYIIDPLDARQEHVVRFLETPVEEALRKLLRGISYAVLYLPATDAGFINGAGSGETPAFLRKHRGAFGTMEGSEPSAAGRSGNVRSTGFINGRQDARETSFSGISGAGVHYVMMGGGVVRTGGQGKALGAGGETTNVNPSGGDDGLSGNQTAGVSPLPDNVGSATMPSDPSERKQWLTDRIVMLEESIESGHSDRRYEFWTQQMDPKFVVHDQVYLDLYRKRLAELNY